MFYIAQAICVASIIGMATAMAIAFSNPFYLFLLVLIYILNTNK